MTATVLENKRCVRYRKNKLKQYKLIQWATDLAQTIDIGKLKMLMQAAPSLSKIGIQATP